MANRKRKINTPFWQSEKCPAWCYGGHHKSDAGSDRRHMSRWDKRIRFSLYDTLRPELGETYDVPADVVAYLAQDYREIEPRIVIEPEHSRADLSGLELTVAEATKLAEALTKAVSLAEQGARWPRRSAASRRRPA